MNIIQVIQNISGRSTNSRGELKSNKTSQDMHNIT